MENLAANIGNFFGITIAKPDESIGINVFEKIADEKMQYRLVFTREQFQKWSDQGNQLVKADGGVPLNTWESLKFISNADGVECLRIQASSCKKFTNKQTLHYRSRTDGAEEIQKISFTSEKGFELWLRSNTLYHMQTDGVPVFLSSLADALDAIRSEEGYLYVTCGGSEFACTEDVQNLKRAQYNHSESLEKKTTKAIVANQKLQAKFGPLELVANGESVKFYAVSGVSKKDKGQPFVEVDGLVQNTTLLILNSTKMFAKEADVKSVRDDAIKLTTILLNPSLYFSIPPDVIFVLERAGISQVLPYLSAYHFPKSVAIQCTQQQVLSIETNGSDFSATNVDGVSASIRSNNPSDLPDEANSAIATTLPVPSGRGDA